MKQTIHFSDFVQAFRNSDRANQFSREALATIFDRIEEYERDGGKEVELDIIAICCEWTEDTAENIEKEYAIDRSQYEKYSDDGQVECVMQYLWDNTDAIELDNGNIVYINF